MKKWLAVLTICGIGICSGPLASAAVIWADNFEVGSRTTANPYDYAGGAAGNDYSETLGGNSIAVSGGTLNIVDTTNQQALLFVGANQFSANATNPGDKFKISFDWRINSMQAAAGNSVPRFGIHNGNDGSGSEAFTLGFGYGNAGDGDASTSDLAFYRIAGGAAGTFTNPIGLSGSSWLPGFDFGDYDSTTFTNNDTNGAFYRIALELTQGSNLITGSLTNLNTTETVSFNSTLGSVLDWSATGSNLDGIRLISGQGGFSSVNYDNISVELTAIPEPSFVLFSCLGLAGVAMLRARRSGN